MKEGSTVIKLGELLIRVGILKTNELEDAIRTAGETGLPIGRVLIMSGYMTDRELHAAVQAQSLIKDKVVEIETAFEALKQVSQEDVTLEQALRKRGWAGKKTADTAKLGELLRSSELVNDDQLNECLQTSQETGLPLGRILVLTQAISEELLAAALTAQILIRDGKVSKEQAIKGLRASKRRRVSLEESLIDQGFYKPPLRQTVKLGELFVLSGLVTDSDLMGALEIGLTREMPIGQVLVDCGYISREVLNTALKFQEMVVNGTLNALQASEALRQVATRSISMAQSVAELGLLKSEQTETIKLGEILKAAGIVTEDDIKSAIDLSARNSALIGKILLVTGLINEQTLHASLRAQFLVREGFLRMEQAIIALNHCEKHSCSFDDAIQELGWTMPTPSRVKMPGEVEP
jgi:CBS domain-containing protein